MVKLDLAMENVEWKLLPKAVSLFCQDKIEIIDGKAYVNG